MKTVNEIKVMLQRSAVVVAVAIVAAVAVMKAARAGDDAQSKYQTEASAIFSEVMKECHHKSVSEAFIFVVAHRLGQEFPTPEQEAKYLADEKNYAHAQATSKCWTKDRWTRYVKATIEDLRFKAAKVNAARNGSK